MDREMFETAYKRATFCYAEFMIRFLFLFLVLMIGACQSSPRNAQQAIPTGLGQYVRPAYLDPAPVPRLPQTDACGSNLYQGLVGQPEGAIFIPGLPGSKRVLKPAFDEGFDQERDPLGISPTLIQVRDYLPGQSLYAPSVRTPGSLLAPADYDLNRLTIELDEEGLVQSIRCG